MDALEAQALKAVGEAISTHGWPWTLNADGRIDTEADKARYMLALMYVMGYGAGVEESGQLIDSAVAELQGRLDS